MHHTTTPSAATTNMHCRVLDTLAPSCAQLAAIRRPGWPLWPSHTAQEFAVDCICTHYNKRGPNYTNPSTSTNAHQLLNTQVLAFTCLLELLLHASWW
jgi:hypothetical protein